MADETKQLRVRFVTPEQKLFDKTAETVVLRSKTGYFQVLYGHAPLMAELGPGEVILRGLEGDAASELRYYVSWGFAEVLGDRVTILGSDAIKPEEIDRADADRRLEHGQELLRAAGEGKGSYDEALGIIAEAEARQAVAIN
jgi:F-type H+-transporting ATPase subunit epsilon